MIKREVSVCRYLPLSWNRLEKEDSSGNADNCGKKGGIHRNDPASVHTGAQDPSSLGDLYAGREYRLPVLPPADDRNADQFRFPPVPWPDALDVGVDCGGALSGGSSC